MPVYDLLLSASIDKTDYVTPLFPISVKILDNTNTSTK